MRFQNSRSFRFQTYCKNKPTANESPQLILDTHKTVWHKACKRIHNVLPWQLQIYLLVDSRTSKLRCERFVLVTRYKWLAKMEKARLVRKLNENIVFCDVTPCSFVEDIRRFRNTYVYIFKVIKVIQASSQIACCFLADSPTVSMDAEVSSETSTRRHNMLHAQRCENFIPDEQPTNYPLQSHN
jgi:hypothetical protein